MEILIDNSIINLSSDEQFEQILGEIDLSASNEILMSGHGDNSLTILTGLHGAILMFQNEETSLIKPEEARQAMVNYYYTGSKLETVSWKKMK